jgi:hypothetical protein
MTVPFFRVAGVLDRYMDLPPDRQMSEALRTLCDGDEERRRRFPSRAPVAARTLETIREPP